MADMLILFGGILASSATLPYIWFLFPALIKNHYVYFGISEIFAVMAETIVYFFLLRLSLKKSFFLSFICNMGSWITGELLRMAT